MGKNKIGRNDPCTCDSGKKYKYCCGRSIHTNIPKMPIQVFPGLQQQIDKSQAEEAQRRQQQGRGKPIVSENFKGHKVVAIGNKLLFSEKEKWKTMHEFLMDFIKICFGKEWWLTEVKKSETERHTIIKWAFEVHEQMSKHYEKLHNSGRIASMKMSGVISVYLHLAYHLYLIQHNVEFHQDLVKRLKQDGEPFRSACYEAYVAAKFALAGFVIELEDETKSDTTHHEFLAIHKKSKNKYHVEAKSRAPNKQNNNIGNQLYKALRKAAKYKRIVFIELNQPLKTKKETMNWIMDVYRTVKEKEQSMTIDDGPAPAAYLFVTNTTDTHNLDSTAFSHAVAPFGFKINDFGYGSEYSRILDAVNAKRKHADLYDLVESIENFGSIPATFNGENPHLNGQHSHPELQLGKEYPVEYNGKMTVGVLSSATVIEKEKRAHLAFNTREGSTLMTYDLTPEELAAYKLHPDTFFGKYQQVSKTIKTPIDAFEFFYTNFKGLSKKELLKRLKNHTDYKSLKKKPQSELCDIYCEALASQV